MVFVFALHISEHLNLKERFYFTNQVQHFQRQHQEVCELYKELSSTVPPKHRLVSSHWIHYDCTSATGHNNDKQPVTTKNVIIVIPSLLKPLIKEKKISSSISKLDAVWNQS